MADANGVEAEVPPVVKEEPIEPVDPIDIPKDILAAVTNGICPGDDDIEDVRYYTQTEIDNTRKCLENTKLIIKDYETQLDWHLQQYMTLRNIYNSKKGIGKVGKDGKRSDLISISHLSSIIANHAEGNKSFIKRRVVNGRGSKRSKDSEEEDSEEYDSEMDSEDYDEEEDYGEGDSEEVDDPSESDTSAVKGKGKKKPAARGRRRGKNISESGDDSMIVPKDEIEEEIHELVVPKEEKDSDDDEEMDFDEDEEEEEFVPPKKTKGGKTPAKKTPAKKAPAKKTPAKKTPAKKTPAKKRGKAAAADSDDDDEESYAPPAKKAATPRKPAARGKKANQNKEDTVDSTNLKKCSVRLNRCDNDDDETIEIKDEEISKEELHEFLKPKLIDSIEKFAVKGKTSVLLDENNVEDFEFDDKKSVFVITYEEEENIPEFVYTNKDVSNNILNGSIKLVQAAVYDQHVEENEAS